MKLFNLSIIHTLYTYQKNVYFDFLETQHISLGLLTQIRKQVFECENKLTLLLELNIDRFLECPFSLFQWLNSELSFDNETSKSIFSTLTQMYLAPSVIDFNSESLVSVAIFIALAKKGSVVGEESVWNVFGQTFESVSGIAITFNTEIQNISIDKIFEGIPKYWQFNRNIERMFMNEGSRRLKSKIKKCDWKRKQFRIFIFGFNRLFSKCQF